MSVKLHYHFIFSRCFHFAKQSRHPYNLTYLWHSVVAKYSLEDGNGSANDDVITDVLHDGGGLACHQRQQHRGLVQVPEEKQLPPTRCCTAHVTKQVGIGVPEHTVKTQHHLSTESHHIRFEIFVKMNDILL